MNPAGFSGPEAVLLLFWFVSSVLPEVPVVMRQPPPLRAVVSRDGVCLSWGEVSSSSHQPYVWRLLSFLLKPLFSFSSFRGITFHIFTSSCLDGISTFYIFLSRVFNVDFLGHNTLEIV